MEFVHRVLRSLAVGAVLGVLASVSMSCGPAGSPSELGIEPSDLPAPGLCRVLVSDRQERDAPQSCRGIEFRAPAGSRVVYRPADGSRRVVVCYMSLAERNTIAGVDLFDLDTRQLLEVLQRYNDPPLTSACEDVLAALGR